MQYRFDKVKDTKWSSYDRQKERYETISSLLGENAVGAEIGVYRGGFGEFLLPHCSLLYLVDPWYIKSPYWSDDRTPENSTVRACINILTAYTDEIESGRLKVVVNYSSGFLASLPDDSLDWVYIDSSHRYESTVEEIALSVRKVKSGGYLIGDDYAKPGVERAVTEHLEAAGRSLALKKKNQWAVENRK